MRNPDRGPRILAFAIALAIVGMIFTVGYARADSFAERFTGMPKADVSPAVEQWSITLLLIIDGKIARSVPFNAEVYPTSDACRNAVNADTGLQERAQKAAKLAGESYGPTAAIGIACAMQLD